MHITMTTRAFVHTFFDKWQSQDGRFCFVLGAGASRSSGIKTGGALAWEWLQEIEDRMKGSEGDYEAFLKEHNIDPENPASAYPVIYSERFRWDATSGFDRINREMETARPGFGYSVLAQILAESRHNIVITTNFDNLTEEALYTYTHKRPLVCGHESLAGFAKPSANRPLVVKIHRDRFLDPMSDPDHTGTLEQPWVAALDKIFQSCIPVFIGYGGNDGSLMGYLEKIDRFDNLFWCERKGTSLPPRVAALLDKHDGKRVDIAGFDELMFQLRDKLSLPLLSDEIEAVADERVKAYEERLKEIGEKEQQSANDKEDKEVVERFVEEGGNDWWTWQLRADAASADEMDRIYREGLDALPQSFELRGNYAVFLSNIRKDYDHAEEHYQRALATEPGDADNNGNYASFLTTIRKEHDRAEDYYQRALAAEPDNANINGNYAYLLTTIRKEHDRAEDYYQRALAAEPDNVNNNGNYASFLTDIRKEHDRAEYYYQQALTAEPDNANINGNYANFLTDIRKDYTRAEAHYQRALSTEPRDANSNSNYASFLIDIRKDYTRAEEHYLQAFAAEPENPNNNGNYAGFLFSVNRPQEAVPYLQTALEHCDRDDLRAELYFYQYAHLPQERDAALISLKALLCQGARSIGFNLQPNVEQAIKDQHPAPALLQQLADILTADAPLGDLCEDL